MVDMTLDEIYALIASKCNCSTFLAKRVWTNTISLIVSELQNNLYINFDNFGKFELIQTGGHDEWITNKYGAMEKQWVDFDLSIKFTPKRGLINAIKGDGDKEWIGKRCEEDLTIRTKGTDLLEERLKLPITEDMKDKILLLVGRKDKSTLKEVDNIWNRKIFCVENKKQYDSVRKCAEDLNVSYITLIRRYNKAVQNHNYSFGVFGYNFEVV